MKHAKEGLTYIWCAQEALLDDAVKIFVVKDVHLFEVTRVLDTFNKFLPLAFEDIYLKVLIKVINEEAHVLP